jgi:hypothetical protein
MTITLNSLMMTSLGRFGGLPLNETQLWPAWFALSWKDWPPRRSHFQALPTDYWKTNLEAADLYARS